MDLSLGAPIKQLYIARFSSVRRMPLSLRSMSKIAHIRHALGRPLSLVSYGMLRYTDAISAEPERVQMSVTSSKQIAIPTLPKVIKRLLVCAVFVASTTAD